MAKHSFQHTCRMPPTWFLLFAVLVVGLEITPGWAGQQSTKNPTPGDNASPAAGQKMAKVKRVKSAKAPGERSGKTAVSHGSEFAAGRRDPFKLPEVATAKAGGNMIDSVPGGALPPGARGLLISQVRLEGVVREQAANKMIAVVTNETRRAYFLTENESVYNGVVSKITPDAVYFTENVLDAHGRVTTREVVKRLGPASGEGR